MPIWVPLWLPLWPMRTAWSITNVGDSRAYYYHGGGDHPHHQGSLSGGDHGRTTATSPLMRPAAIRGGTSSPALWAGIPTLPATGISALWSRADFIAAVHRRAGEHASTDQEMLFEVAPRRTIWTRCLDRLLHISQKSGRAGQRDGSALMQKL